MSYVFLQHDKNDCFEAIFLSYFFSLESFYFFKTPKNEAKSIKNGQFTKLSSTLLPLITFLRSLSQIFCKSRNYPYLCIVK